MGIYTDHPDFLVRVAVGHSNSGGYMEVSEGVDRLWVRIMGGWFSDVFAEWDLGKEEAAAVGAAITDWANS